MQIIVVLVGIFLLGLGFYFVRNGNVQSNQVEILETQEKKEIVIEIAGSVKNPGVYKLPEGSRIEDLLVVPGGINEKADKNWMEKNLNRAAKLIDGQKVYIFSTNEQSNVLSAKNSVDYQNISTNISGQGSGFININTVSQKELESLIGIGPIYAQNIIEHRPYSNIEELLSKSVLPKSTYEKIKDKITAN